MSIGVRISMSFGLSVSVMAIERIAEDEHAEEEHAEEEHADTAADHQHCSSATTHLILSHLRMLVAALHMYSVAHSFGHQQASHGILLMR